MWWNVRIVIRKPEVAYVKTWRMQAVNAFLAAGMAAAECSYDEATYTHKVEVERIHD